MLSGVLSSQPYERRCKEGCKKAYQMIAWLKHLRKPRDNSIVKRQTNPVKSSPVYTNVTFITHSSLLSIGGRVPNLGSRLLAA